MRDVKYSELIDELQKEFPIFIPKIIIRRTIKSGLLRVFNIISKPDREISFHLGGITKIFQLHDGSRYIKRVMDLDETVIPDKDKFYRGIKIAEHYKKIVFEDKKHGHARQKLQIFWGRNRSSYRKTLRERRREREICTRGSFEGKDVSNVEYQPIQKES